MVKKLCERAYNEFNEEEYERLSKISVSHIYNLRKTSDYKQHRCNFEKTKSQKGVKIGERRKPINNGMPGYIRIDTVHQGDLDGYKGVYHINAVDEVTQYEVVASVEKISEAYLLPVLEELLEAFPFKIINFHSDNGSEYVNKTVAKLLGKLLIEFTKSRPRTSNDNALAEGKNAAVVRKIFGYTHIPQYYAKELNQFNRNVLNPYINYHRPCLYPTIIIDKKGKQKKKYEYKNMMTPYEKLKTLENAEQYLKEGITFKKLDDIAKKMTDNEAAERLQKQRKLLFKTIHEDCQKTA
jgi:transposase InsO family protein